MPGGRCAGSRTPGTDLSTRRVPNGALILDDPDDADDATQEVFVSALRGLASFQENASLKTWLFSITINVCRSRLKRLKSRGRLQQILEACSICGAIRLTQRKKR